MKFCQLNSITLLWYFEQLYFSTCLVSVVREVTLTDPVGVEEKGEVSIPNPGPMTAYDDSYVFVSSTDSTGKGSVVVLDSKVMEELTSKLFKEVVLHATVHVVPENTFEFNALVIAGTVTDSSASTALTVVNVDNVLAPTFHGVIDKAIKITGIPYSFGNPAWISKDECFVCRSVRITDVTDESMALDKIVLFKKDPAFHSWNGRPILQMKCSFIYVFKAIFKEFDVLFVIDQIDDALKLIWYDDERNQDWSDLTKVKTVVIADDAPVMDAQFLDANVDGEIDMLVTVASHEGEVRAYQVPRSRGFKHYFEYGWFLMIGDFKSVEGKSFCPGTLKPFYPYKGYVYKPWFLVSGGECGKVVYLVPENYSFKSWTYHKYLVLEGSERIDGIEVVDINKDGLADIFVSIGERGLVRMFSMSKSVPPKPDVSVASNATLNTSFGVDTTVPSFSGTSGLLVNYMALVISLCFFSFSFFSKAFYDDVI